MRRKKRQGARKGRKVAIHCVFPMICGSGGSKSRLAKGAMPLLARDRELGSHAPAMPHAVLEFIQCLRLLGPAVRHCLIRQAGNQGAGVGIDWANCLAKPPLLVFVTLQKSLWNFEGGMQAHMLHHECENDDDDDGDDDDDDDDHGDGDGVGDGDDDDDDDDER